MFNPVIASENIRNEYVDYIATLQAFADSRLQSQLIDELRNSVSKGPILEIKDIFESGASMNSLIDEGVLSPLFRDLESRKPTGKLYKKRLPLDRPLYIHQERAIRKIVSGDNVVVSTGTGSGKTNCFLIPVLDELLKEKAAGTLSPGVRAMFIYPMNALANDQLKNLRHILMYYPDITFGVYNGSTEYEEDEAINVYESMFANEKVPELRHRLSNEILSRDQMKATPPNILFTNYAMLEHLLLRPKDDILFSSADFRFVVLDEAHVYNGATGIETALLLRRLRARINTTAKTQFILTSATLGSDESSDDDILLFANNLCGVDFNKGSIIRGIRKSYQKIEKTDHHPESFYKELADEQNIVWSVLSTYGINCNKDKPEDELLYEVISKSDLYHKLRQNINGICDLKTVPDILGIDMSTTIAFVSLCTRAQKNEVSLIDARYHFFIRSLEGCYITIAEEPRLFLNRRREYYENGKRFAVFEVAVCNDCGRIAYVGQIENRKLVQANKVTEDVLYFYPESDDNEDLDRGELKQSKSEVYYLCPICGAITPVDEVHNAPCECGIENYVKVVKARQLSRDARCGNCASGTYQRFYLGNDAATSVLATSLYEELPEIEYEEESTQQNVVNIFAKAIATSDKKVARRKGRQFLVFSDSRQEAAKFACYLGSSYNEFLRRRGICQILQQYSEDIRTNNYTVSDLVTKLTSFFTSKKSFAKSNSDESNLTVNSNKNAWVALLNELYRYNASTSLCSLGLLQFEYLGNTPEIVQAISNGYGISYEDSRNLLNLLAFEIVKTGAICSDTDSDIDDDDRTYIFYSATQRFITYMQAPNNKRANITSWAPRNIGESTEKFYKSNRIDYVCNTLNCSQKEASDFLKQYYDYLTRPDMMNKYPMVDPNKNQTFVMPAKYFRVRVPGDPQAHWYKCKKCGRISPFNLKGKCTLSRCGGDLTEINATEICSNNHFAKLYLSERMAPLFIKEHTAQLSKKESADYQEQFIKKDINALSCSTTFEMGVDVGDLETVFLRNVPPLPSNYAQRAGRAGRTVNAAAYALTFAKLSSHDLSFFKEPNKMIGGVILAPLFKVDNEKIVRRHIYAIALSMFFALNEEQYNHNDANEFINKKGYLKFIEWIKSHPVNLKNMLERSIPDIDGLHERIGISDFSWIDAFCGADGTFTQLIAEYETNIENFQKLVSQYMMEGDLSKANSCQKRLGVYQKNRLIEFLARGNILPRYGFPVDTVELYQNTVAGNISKLRLNRDLQLAIAEYAPSSEVIADGRMYTSRYIKKSAIGTNQKEWHTAYIGYCDNPECQAVNYSIQPVVGSGMECISCKKKLSSVNFFESIEPRAGFVAEKADKPVPLTKQEKNYRSDDYYIGNKAARVIEKKKYNVNGIEITIESTTNDSLLVVSYNSFYVCSVCGYSIAEDEPGTEKNLRKQMLSKALVVNDPKQHDSLFGNYSCKNRDLFRRKLHHTFNTDVAKITFGCDTSDYATMVSVMYAILYAVADRLNIERRDIKACLQRIISDGIASYSIILYDSVPGGAGHSRRIVTDDGRVFSDILTAAYGRMVSCDCDPSCYSCLRSYENQRIHDILDRNLAADFLAPFVGDLKKVNDEESEEIYQIASVSFSDGGSLYDYICTIQDIRIGDTVEVNAAGSIKRVKVMRLYKSNESGLKLDLSQYKKILRVVR